MSRGFDSLHPLPMKSYKNIDEHIADFPIDVQKKLTQIRAIVQKEVPDAVETIKYGIPTFVYRGVNMFHFAAYPKHIGIYPGPKAVSHFAPRLAGYHTSTGTIQLPHEGDLPSKLICDIVAYCADAIEKRA